MFNKKRKQNIFNNKLKRNKTAYNEIFKKELDGLNEIIRSKKYDVDTMLSKSNLGHAYHDLIDSKDKLNSKHQSRYNQAYHSIDVKIYKLNKKIDNETKLINYKYNNKKERIIEQIMFRAF